MKPIQILIADDHALFRSGLVALFGSLEETVIVAQAASGAEAVALAAQHQPDIILMDIQMPTPDGSGLNGIEATRRIIQQNPQIGVIMVTMFEDDDSVFAAMRAGARGYILKGAAQEEMLRVIEAVAQGEALFGAAIATRLMRFFARPQPAAAVIPFPELTDREQELLAWIAKGYNNRDIANQHHISIKTVRNHVSNILGKLQVADRAQAIIRARDAGLG